MEDCGRQYIFILAQKNLIETRTGIYIEGMYNEGLLKMVCLKIKNIGEHFST